jgi:malate dehydrogenase (oxaloacetate-decarboxylating)
MAKKYFKKIRNTQGDIDHVQISVKGRELLNIPLLNKGMAFTKEERQDLELSGILPSAVETIEEQVQRHYQQFKTKDTSLGRHVFLMQLHDYNTTAFYRLVQDHMEEMLPIIYTPTVGDSVQNFSMLIRRPRGIYLNYEDKDSMDSIISQQASDEIDFIIVTDGEAVLGIGDQGVGGMDISVGKLMVYILFSGIDPSRVLPIFLDVGTDNDDLLNDPIYIGRRQKRIRGEAYDDFIDLFVQSVRKHFSNVYLHWEDFGRDTARKNLERYQDVMCTFNDDMQGTGIVTTANILSAIEGQGLSMADQRIVMHGAGTASCGIADQICETLIEAGLSKEEARKRFWMINSKGLLTEYQPKIEFFQEPYVQTKESVDNWNVANKEKITLEEVVKNAKPTILVGCSTVQNAFNETIVKEMLKYVARPIIMPLSNPTSKSEAHPDDLIRWTDGKAIIATGSPFKPVEYKGKTYPVPQGNNAYIFPGLGLGIIAVKASRLTGGMIRAACQALSELSPFRQDNDASLLLPITEAKELSQVIAKAVIKQAIQDGVCTVDISNIDVRIKEIQWEPKYYSYKFV